MKPVFADTSFYIACLNPRDAHHALAIELASKNKTTTLTTEFVFIELANFFSKLANRSASVQLIRQVHSDPDTVIVPASSELMQRGFDRFSRRPDKEWSLTDCISFVVMEEYGITDALTSDRDFEQAGFAKLL